MYGAYYPKLKLHCIISHGIGMFFGGEGGQNGLPGTDYEFTEYIWNIYEMVQNGKRRKQIVAGGKAGKGHQGTEP